MSRREEVEELKNQIDAGIGPVEIGLQVAADEALEKLAALALSSIPTRYTPREEVTEGWWFASEIGTGRDREPIEVYVQEIKDSETGHVEKSLRCGVQGIHPEWENPPITLFTDFLPVPAWLVEGIGE